MKRLMVVLFAGMTTWMAQAQTVIDTTKVEALDEVLVKSVRVEADSPITHSNVTKEELAPRNLGQDIPILLNYLPGVVTNSDAGAGVGYTGIRVRGSDASRVNVTLNGIPFNDAESQGTFWVNLPDFASSVENLQLQRGVGTSSNGSGAFGASLNILTDAVSEEANGEFANSFGSFNTRKHTLKFSTGLLNGKWEIAGRLSNITSDGYIDRATSDLKSYFLQAAYVGDNTLIKALAFGGRELTYQAYFGIDRETLETNRTFNPVGQFTDANGNTQFYDNEVDDYAQDHYQLHWNQRFDNNWSATVGLNYTYGRGFFEQYREDEDFETYGFTPIELGGEVINTTDLVRRRWLDNDYYVVNTSVNYKDNSVDIVGGFFYSYYGGDHFGEVIWAQNAGGSQLRDRYYFGTGTKNEFTTFAKATYRIDEQWTVFADLQGRFIDYQADGTTSDLIALNVDDNFSFFNPKAGASYKLNSNDQLYASYGRANREPRRADYENGVTTAETLDDFELGWRHTGSKNSFSANAYFMNYRNQLVLTGALDDVGQPIRATSGKSYRLGLEVEANLQIAPKLNWRPNIALSSNKNQDFTTSRDGELVNLGTTNISYSPELIAGSILTYMPQEDLQISFLSKYVSEQYMGNIDSEASLLDSFFVNDLNISYSWETAPLVERIVFSGLVNNIFNVEYVSNGYFFTFDDDFSNPGTVTTIEGAGFFPQATINFLVGASIQF
ncbi:TonB-dependent receptor [Gilvibacter sp.]|uniref:TonB-dependent receptor n=1 Tax=Gilvibacter sp. TaxID=2729997 RepID=UPI0035BE3E8E